MDQSRKRMYERELHEMAAERRRERQVHVEESSTGPKQIRTTGAFTTPKPVTTGGTDAGSNVEGSGRGGAHHRSHQRAKQATSTPVHPRGRPTLPSSLVAPLKATGSSSRAEGAQSRLGFISESLNAATAEALSQPTDEAPLEDKDMAERSVNGDRNGGDDGDDDGDDDGPGDEGGDEEEWEEASPITPKEAAKAAKAAKLMRRLLRELYTDETNKIAYKALIGILQQVLGEKEAAGRSSKSKRRFSSKKPPPVKWTQEGRYVCTSGRQHRERLRIAAAGQIRYQYLELLNRKSAQDPLPPGPPPHVAAPTDHAFYIAWLESPRSLFNATATEIVTRRVMKDYPELFDTDEIFEMATMHLKYLQRCYRRQNDQSLAPKEAERHRRCNADTRKRTTYEHRLRIINTSPALERHGRLIESLGIDGTSSDEEDPDHKGVYIIKRIPELSGEVHQLKGQLDLAYEVWFKGPGSKGNQVHKRVDRGVLGKKKFKIEGLPLNCMNQTWLLSLTDIQKAMFQFDDFAYDFSFPTELLSGQ